DETFSPECDRTPTGKPKLVLFGAETVAIPTIASLRVALDVRHGGRCQELRGNAIEPNESVLVDVGDGAATAVVSAVEDLRRENALLCIIIYGALSASSVRLMIELTRAGADETIYDRDDMMPSKFLTLLEGAQAR